jgi:hypothetical protein
MGLTKVVWDESLPIHSNMFPCKKELRQQNLTIDLYHIDGILKDDNHFRNLSKVVETISHQLGVLVVPYSPGEKDYAMALEPTIAKTFSGIDYPVTLEKQADALLNFPQQAREFHYEAARHVLQRHGMWRYTYNRYFEYFPEKVIDEYEIYRGLWFRYDLVKGKIYVTIDPTTRVTTQNTVWELISKLGKEEAKKKFANRYVLAIQEKGKAIYQVARIDFNINVNQECFRIDNKDYSVKEYFRRPGGKAELAYLISDNECVIFVRRRKGAKELAMAPSLLKLVLRTEDFPRERTLKRDLQNEVYLSAERRRLLTQKFLTILNPLPLGRGCSAEFDAKEVSEMTNEAAVVSAPELMFGKKSSVTPDFSNYGFFMKNTLREHGPAKKATFSNNKIVIIYPSIVAKGIMRKFYDDCKWISRKFFRTYLPEKPVFYSYPDVDVRKEYDSFSEYVDGVIAVIQHEEETETYINFKEWFDKPNQILTYRVIDERYRLLKEQIGRYYNLILNVCAGLLGKMGSRPWILNNRLGADFYVGLDVGGEKKARVACYTFFDEFGNFVGEEWRPQRAEEIDPLELKRTIVNAIKGHREHIDSLVIHRDGEFTAKELQGVQLVQSELLEDGTMSKDSHTVCVNVKKTVPYRLYEIQKEQQNGCKVGSYIILDVHTGIIATSGAPLLKQGTARPMLIELVPPFDKADIKIIMKDLYYLSFMHWGSILLKMKLPATLRYADALTPFALKSIRITGVPL